MVVVIILLILSNLVSMFVFAHKAWGMAGATAMLNLAAVIMLWISFNRED